MCGEDWLHETLLGQRCLNVDLGCNAQRLVEGHLGMLFRHHVAMIPPLMGAPALLAGVSRDRNHEADQGGGANTRRVCVTRQRTEMADGLLQSSRITKHSHLPVHD